MLAEQSEGAGEWRGGLEFIDSDSNLVTAGGIQPAGGGGGPTQCNATPPGRGETL